MLKKIMLIPRLSPQGAKLYAAYSSPLCQIQDALEYTKTSLCMEQMVNVSKNIADIVLSFHIFIQHLHCRFMPPFIL